MDSEHVSNGDKGDHIFSSSSIYFVGPVLALGFFSVWLAQNFCTGFTGFASGKFGGICDWRRGNFMQLKMFVLSGVAITLWLIPLVALDKKVTWHKSIQGISLIAAVSCALGAGNIARQLAGENEIEEIKTRAITADVIDEISTSAYVSQQQRQQEAELILTSPGVDVEASRQTLEAIYSNNLQDSASTSGADASDLALWWKVSAAEVEGKSHTWIIENILNMKGRKFAEGKVRLVELQKKFGEG